MSNNCLAQADTTPVYLRFPTIPDFSIYNAKDSSLTTREVLKKKRPTLIILFSPDCNHCQHETKAIEANMDKFSKVNIVMITDLHYADMKAFYKEYDIASYPEIIMGKEAKYYLPLFYNVKFLPAMFVYDKKGHFKKAFEGSVKIEKILEEL